MGFPDPGVIIPTILKTTTTLRKYLLRHLALPRPQSRAVRTLNASPDPTTGLYTINLWIAQPWYVAPSFQNRWGLKALLARVFGDGAVPRRDGGFREGGNDMRSIGRVAQEKRGREKMERG